MVLSLLFYNSKYFPLTTQRNFLHLGIHEYAYLKMSHLHSLDELMTSVMCEQPETLLHFRINDMPLNEYVQHASIEKEKLDKMKRKRLEDVQSFIYFHQSPSQRSMLEKYGSTLYITQIKTSERSSKILAVSMYLLAVRTNVDYQVVGTILMNKYNEKPLREILNLYKEVNEGWIPKYFMIDMSEDLLFSVTELFPGKCKWSKSFSVWSVFDKHGFGLKQVNQVVWIRTRYLLKTTWFIIFEILVSTKVDSHDNIKHVGLIQDH